VCSISVTGPESQILHSVFQSRPYTRRQVKLSLTLPIALADFNASVQQTFKEQMALAAGLPKADSWRVTLAVRAARRRLLAGAGVSVDVVINMPDATTARAAVSSLSQSKINTQLAAAGLPAATVTLTAALDSGASPRAWSRAMLLTAASGAAVLGLLGKAA
jgi:lysozyme family protein